MKIYDMNFALLNVNPDDLLEIIGEAEEQTTDPPNPPKTTANKTNTGALTSPRTGDNSNLLLWTALLLVSIFGVAGATFYNRKKKIR